MSTEFHLAIYWRNTKERLSLQGSVCNGCGTTLFGPGQQRNHNCPKPLIIHQDPHPNYTEVDLEKINCK